MTLSREQLELRRTRVGGSEIAALIEDPRTGESCHPYKSALDVFRDKLGYGREEEDNEGSNEMEWGSHLEPAICTYVAARMKLELVEIGSIAPAKYPFAIATPDRVARTLDATDPRIWNVEAKSVGPYAAKLWRRGDNDAAAPLGYGMQVIWEMGMLRAQFPGEEHASEGLLAAAISGAPPRVFRIPWDQPIFDALLERAEAFVRNHVLTGIEPAGWHKASGALEYIRERWAKSDGGVLVPTDDDKALALAWAGAREMRLTAEKTESQLAAQLCHRIAGNEALGDLVTWRTSSNGNRPLHACRPLLALLSNGGAPALPPLAKCGAPYEDRYSHEQKTCPKPALPGSERCRRHQPKPPKEEQPHV